MHRILAIILGVALLASPALAQQQGHWYIGGDLHYVDLEDSRNRIGREGAPASGLDLGELFIGAPGSPGGQERFDVEYDEALGYGLVFGYDFIGAPRLELEMRHYLNDIDNISRDVGDIKDEDGRLESISALVNVWFDFNREGLLRPYVGGGLGATRVRTSGLHDTVFAGQLGAGLNVAITERWRIDVGYRYFRGNDPRLRSDDVRFDSEYGGQSVLLGVRYHFTRPTPPPAEPRPEPVAAPEERNFDHCPGVPPGTDVPLDVELNEDGCPMDSDGDGVPDFLDQCPNTAPGEPVMATGCSVGQSVVLHGVNFEFDRARLTVSAERALDRVARSLVESPGFVVELQGHTDSVGNEEYNYRLSRQRAEAVKEYLVSRGVPEHRVEAKGFGPSRPVADNDTEDGRASNRRVEMVVIDHPPLLED